MSRRSRTSTPISSKLLTLLTSKIAMNVLNGCLENKNQSKNSKNTQRNSIIRESLPATTAYKKASEDSGFEIGSCLALAHLTSVEGGRGTCSESRQSEHGVLPKTKSVIRIP